MTETLRQQFSDDARRMADAMTLHTVAGSAGKFVAFRLQDGRPANNVAYDAYWDAVRDMRWDRDRFVYLKVAPDGMQPKEAEAVLKYARALHDAGFRLPAPDDQINTEFDMPLLKMDRRRQIRLLTRRQ